MTQNIPYSFFSSSFFCMRPPLAHRQTACRCHAVKGKAGPLYNAGVKSQRSVLSFHIKPRSRGQSLIPHPLFALPPARSHMLPALPSSPNSHTHTPSSSSSPSLDVQMPLLSALPQSPVIENNSQGPAPGHSPQPGGSLPL